MLPSFERPKRSLKTLGKIGATSACVACVCNTQQDADLVRENFDVHRPQPSKGLLVFPPHRARLLGPPANPSLLGRGLINFLPMSAFGPKQTKVDFGLGTDCPLMTHHCNIGCALRQWF